MATSSAEAYRAASTLAITPHCSSVSWRPPARPSRRQTARAAVGWLIACSSVRTCRLSSMPTTEATTIARRAEQRDPRPDQVRDRTGRDLPDRDREEGADRVVRVDAGQLVGRDVLLDGHLPGDAELLHRETGEERRRQQHRHRWEAAPAPTSHSAPPRQQATPTRSSRRTRSRMAISAPATMPAVSVARTRPHICRPMVSSATTGPSTLQRPDLGHVEDAEPEDDRPRPRCGRRTPTQPSRSSAIGLTGARFGRAYRRHPDEREQRGRHARSVSRVDGEAPARARRWRPRRRPPRRPAIMRRVDAEPVDGVGRLVELRAARSAPRAPPRPERRRR